MKGIFPMASARVKNLPLEEQFPPDATGHCHESRNMPCFHVLIQKQDNAPQATINLVIESLGLCNHHTEHRTFSTTPNRLKYKASSPSGMSGLDCTVKGAA